jgi:hypoxanthine phosphoribosyltransferase
MRAADEAAMKVLLPRCEIEARVAALGAAITRDYAGRKPHVIGVLKGACLFLSDLIRRVELPLTIDFIAVSSYGAATETSGEVRLLKDVDHSLSGRDVIIVEDIVDSGLTLDFLLRLVGARAPASLKVAALVSKPSRRRTAVTVDYLGFEIEDRFVVGYGLDRDERFRNLPDICAYE